MREYRLTPEQLAKLDAKETGIEIGGVRVMSSRKIPPNELHAVYLSEGAENRFHRAGCERLTPQDDHARFHSPEHQL